MASAVLATALVGAGGEEGDGTAAVVEGTAASTAELTPAEVPMLRTLSDEEEHEEVMEDVSAALVAAVVPPLEAIHAQLMELSENQANLVAKLAEQNASVLDIPQLDYIEETVGAWCDLCDCVSFFCGCDLLSCWA